MRDVNDMMSRRRFLGAGAAGLAALAGTASANDPFGGFTVGIQSYSFRRFDLAQTLKRTQELGLHYVEFYRNHVPVSSSPQQIQAIRRLCADHEITPVAFGVESFTEDHDKNRRVFEFGKALGIQHLSADPSPDSFDSLDKLVDEYRISIAIHPHGPVGKSLHRWYSAEVILAAVKDHHPLIGTCLDTGHLIRAAQLGKKLDPAQQVLAMGARNFGMHLKDHDNRRHTDVVYGKGELDVAALLRALRQVSFKGYIAIEYEANEENPSPDIRACIDVFKQAAKAAASSA